MARILVVDDDRFMRELLQTGLGARGHNVTATEDAIAGINCLLKTDFDVVLSDIDMPYLDGVEFLRAVVNDDRTSHIPVVFFTAITSQETWLEAMRAGAAGYLTKPLHLEEVDLELERVLRRTRDAG